MTAGLRLVLLAALGLLAGCFKDDASVIQGYVEGDAVNLGLPAGGRVVRVLVHRGETVAAGQAVFALDAEAEDAALAEAEAKAAQARASRDNLLTGKREAEIRVLESDLAKARSALRLAEIELRRQQGLIGSAAAQQARLDTARATRDQAAAAEASLAAQIAVARLPARKDEIAAADRAVEAADATLAQAKKRRADREAQAPAAGRIEDVLFREGEVVTAGQPVVRILPPANVVVRAYLSAAAVARLDAGGIAVLRCGACGAAARARLSFVSDEAAYTPPVLYSRDNRAKLAFLTEFTPDPATAPKLRPGQPVEIVLPGSGGK